MMQQENPTPHALFQKRGEFSKTAFWFSLTMALSLLSVLAIVVRYLCGSAEVLGGLEAFRIFCDSLDNMALLIGAPNVVLAGAYTWGKALDNNSRQSDTGGPL